MKMHDVNQEQTEVVLLLHPMLATGDIMHALLAEPMGQEYRYLIPDFSGHGTALSDAYESAMGEARQICAYLEEQGIHRLRLAFGASMGAVVLMELLRAPGIQIDRLFFEGASMHTHGVFNAILKYVMTGKQRKARAYPQIAMEKMGQLYGDQVKEIMVRQMISLPEESLSHIIRDCARVRLPELTPEQQRGCVFAYGEKDSDLKRAKKLCLKKYPHAKLKVWPGKGHCTYLTEDPSGYAEQLLAHLKSGE